MERWKRLILGLMAVLLVAGPAWSANFEMLAKRDRAGYSMAITSTVTTSDYIVANAQGMNLISFTKGSTLALTVYACETNVYAAGTCGTAKTTLSATTDEVRVYTAKPYLIFDVTTAETAGSTSYLSIASNPQNAGLGAGGAPADTDNDGLYDVAQLWDADGDGSVFVSCTAEGVPDIACKTSGQIVYRDLIDDLNCATFGCGHGQMEVSGVLILKSGRWVEFPCWNASNEGSHTASAADSNDDAHDSTADTAYSSCPVDPDGKRVSVAAFRDWQGTIIGEGADTRFLERGNVPAGWTDSGTYIVNDMGPWDVTKNNNVWFSAGDNSRAFSTGFHSNVTDTNHPNGGSATDSSTSKGWWRVGRDVDFTTWVTDGQTLCLVDSGGDSVAGTHYKTSGTVRDLRPGDTLIVPFKPTGSATYNQFEAVVRATPSVSCSPTTTTGGGYWVDLGGTNVDRSVSTRTLVPHAGSITASSNQLALHPRLGYDNTNVTIANMRFEWQDPWNEYGGRCTSSGTAWKTTVTSTGTGFTTTTDDSNTDNSCDTLPSFGLWGGGKVRFQNIVVAGFAKYPFDAGGTGYADVEDSLFIYGNGGEIADLSNGWRFYNNRVDQSYFGSQVLNIFGIAPQVDTLTITNSTFPRVLYLDEVSPHALIQNIRDEGNSSLYTIGLLCGANQSTIRDVYKTGKAGNTTSGNFPSVVYLECDDTASLITQNSIENITMDAIDTSAGGETAPAVVFNVPAASGNSADAQWGAIVGNVFKNVRSTGYVGGIAGESSCLYAVMEADSDSPADDDGESVIFTKNYFEGGSVEANGRLFCVTNSVGTNNINSSAIDSTGAATPAWGDPQGCGNMDGGVVYADENCQ